MSFNAVFQFREPEFAGGGGNIFVIIQPANDGPKAEDKDIFAVLGVKTVSEAKGAIEGVVAAHPFANATVEITRVAFFATKTAMPNKYLR